MSTKNTSKTQQRKITEADIKLAKQILREWGNYDGEIPGQGLRAIADALATLKQAHRQRKAKGGKKND